MAYQSKESSLFFAGNTPFLEEMYAQYLDNPNSITSEWREFFNKLHVGENQLNAIETQRKNTAARKPINNNTVKSIKAKDSEVSPSTEKIPATTLDSIRALMLIRAYRVRGHLIAHLDPLGLEGEKHHPELDPLTYGFSQKDYNRPIFVDGVLGLQWATLKQMLSVIKQTYCSQIGVEFMHIQEPNEKSWIQQQVEQSRNEPNLNKEKQISILRDLNEAEGFERFLDIKYKGAKRFSLEGSESVIPALETFIEQASSHNVKEIVIGMAHRGRLNVLTSIMGKSYAAVFSEFQGSAGNPEDVQGSGDVKYHLGASADRTSVNGKNIHISLSPNPSHLEAVNPIVLGKVRAKQTMRAPADRREVMGVLIHGDASFAAQGLVAETFELSGLRGYRTSGTVHIVINNQIGFTTSPSHARSSPYCSDIAKSVQAPIFHVSGDNPEAVVQVCRLALAYRQRFSKDVVVDIFCYRRHGHNESDEPAFTQPIMYRAIKKQPTTCQLYADKLVKQNVLSPEEVNQIGADFRNRLETELKSSKNYLRSKADWLEGDWSEMQAPPEQYRPGETGVTSNTLIKIGHALSNTPNDFTLHPRLNRILTNKAELITNGESIDWATAEALALGSLLLEGTPVRFSGQDVSRGTFSQRHAALIDQNTEERFIPLNNICEDQAELELVDSMLSEAGVLGYEYGYSITDPKSLIIWEAQFGDFANGAQVIIDQFVASGEMKWLRMSGLVMLLPHGYEGQGPEHSSARLERYLQLFAQDNIQVVNCTTPSNYFHVLRRQMRRNYRKPLIVMSPKSLLRHKMCVSKKADFSEGTHFHRILKEEDISIDCSDIERVIICSGKVYYDLLEARSKKDLKNVAFIRLEQIAPFPYESLLTELLKYPHSQVIWCQEEPRNMGAWTFVAPKIDEILNKIPGKATNTKYAGRVESASTATGHFKVHSREQDNIISDALNF